MQLPCMLRAAIDREVMGIRLETLRSACENISHSYRNESKERHLRSLYERLGYLITRMPATMAATVRVLVETFRRVPLASHNKTLLDLGAGPGTSLWAAEEAGLSLQRALLIEQDEEMLELGKKLRLPVESWAVSWKNGDFCNPSYWKSQQYDIVLCSYSLGEVAEERVIPILDGAWASTREVLVLIERGTPKGYRDVLRWRDYLLRQKDAYIAAPCTHGNRCPLLQGDWCHFAARVERSRLHRAIKGTLGYEDEKFSYVVFSKIPVHTQDARIVRPTKRRSDSVSLTLCSSEGIVHHLVEKRDVPAYRTAKQSAWGDVWV